MTCPATKVRRGSLRPGIVLDAHGLRVRTVVKQVRSDLGRETIMISCARPKKYPRTARLSIQKVKEASGCPGQKSAQEDLPHGNAEAAMG